MPPDVPLCGALETGGTKFLCAVGSGPDAIKATTRIPTTTPDETLGHVVDFFQQHLPALDALGVGAFGPVDLSPSSPTYGHLLRTPKNGWTDVNLVGILQDALDVPIRLETDVNAAALAEYRWGAAQSVDALLYLTVGTGVGGGVVYDGQCLHGLLHPEMGHIRVPAAPDDTFDGVCIHHQSCLEGMACGPAIERRWGTAPENLPDTHPAWSLQAHYLAHACATLTYALSPERIVLGGGIMQRSCLFPKIRRRLRDLLGRYPDVPQLAGLLDSYIAPPALGTRAGLFGALRLAQQATREART